MLQFACCSSMASKSTALWQAGWQYKSQVLDWPQSSTLKAGKHLWRRLPGCAASLILRSTVSSTTRAFLTQSYGLQSG